MILDKSAQLVKSLLSNASSASIMQEQWVLSLEWGDYSFSCLHCRYGADPITGRVRADRIEGHAVWSDRPSHVPHPAALASSNGGQCVRGLCSGAGQPRISGRGHLWVASLAEWDATAAAAVPAQLRAHHLHLQKWSEWVLRASVGYVLLLSKT